MKKKHLSKSFDAVGLDGPAVVHLLSIANLTSFQEYANLVFILHTLTNLEGTRRVDVVWDTNIQDILKELSRERWGREVRRKLRVQTRFQETGKSFFVTPTARLNCLPFFLKRLSVLTTRTTKKCTSHQVMR